MAQLTADRYFTQIQASTAAIAALVDGGDLSLPVPTCPEWTLRHLATHVGRAHRWAAAITASRSAQFIPFREVPDGRIPDDRAQQAAWLTAGAERVIGAVRDAGDDPVWAFGEMAPAGFWGRRMCHETVVHAADAQLAAGQPPGLPADVAADTIDEWLTVMSGPVLGRPDPRAAGLPQGRALRVRATDPGLADPASWRVSHDGGVVIVARGPAGDQDADGTGAGPADLELSGPAARLLLLLVRRASVAQATDGPDPVTVRGDQALLTQWLAETIF
jgi:uncharacterized protein (TIGR03083 family)